jgi:hypothetical protein
MDVWQLFGLSEPEADHAAPAPRCEHTAPLVLSAVIAAAVQEPANN